MRVLVLGGSGFVGRVVAEQAAGRGWDVTVFNRGRRPAPAGVGVLVGDRRGDLSALESGEWDLVVDTWSADGAVVGRTAELLRGRAGRYAYVSSRSVYRWGVAGVITEQSRWSSRMIPGMPGTSCAGSWRRRRSAVRWCWPGRR